MEWLRLIGFCLLAGALVMLLAQMQPQAAALLSVAFGVLVLGAALPRIAEYVQRIQSFLSSLNLDAQYYRIMLKAMGVVLITQLAVQACEDMGAASIARRAEFLGRLALLSVAVPVFMELTQMAVGVLR
ncbi:MAG: hypothetical protein E7321_06075 [Clostridiales bacterium]|nr:hypothetical protein [Clostridiales bacterium]